MRVETWARMERPPALSQEGQELFRAYTFLKEYGHMPVTGALLQQSAKFLKAVEFCDAVNVAYLRREKKKGKEIENAKRKIAGLLNDSSRR